MSGEVTEKGAKGKTPEKTQEIPEPIQKVLQSIQEFKDMTEGFRNDLNTVNENVRQLSDMVNQHTEGMKMLAQEIGNIKEGAVQGQTPASDDGHESELMGSLTDLAKIVMTRNQPNPFTDMFSEFMRNVMAGTAQLMQSNANMNNAIAQAVTDSVTKSVAKDAGSKIAKVMIAE